jgi:hypothetical protein
VTPRKDSAINKPMSVPPSPPSKAAQPTYSRANPRSGKPNLQYLQNALSDLGINGYVRSGGGNNSDAGNGDPSGSARPSPNIEEWFSGLKAKELEANSDVSPIAPYLTESPKYLWDQIEGGFKLAGEKLGQGASGVAAMVGVPGMEDRRKAYEYRAGVMNDYLARDPNAPMPGSSTFHDITGSPGQLLGNMVAVAPELYNPFSKPGAVAQGAKWLARTINKIGQHDSALNTAYHALMGYAPNKSAQDAAFSGGSHPLGEVVEGALTGGRGIPGQPVGLAIEKALPSALDWFSQPTSAPSPSYIPVRP